MTSSVTKFKPALIKAAVLSAMLSGCASFPSPGERVNLSGVAEQATDTWNLLSPVTYRSVKKEISIHSPTSIPDSIRKYRISMEASGRITAKDLVFLFDQIGIKTVIASEEDEKESLYIPRYEGEFGSFVDLVSETTNLSFSWSNDAVIISKVKDYIVRVPQQKELVEIMALAITSLNGQNVFVSKESGSISYSASTKDQKKINNYLKRISSNTALIHLQLAVINVKLKDERNTGFDWSAFKMNLGDLDDLALSVSGETPSNLVSMDGMNAGFVFNGGSINLASALNLLSTFGESRTDQNLTLQTLSGVPVSLNSGSTIPYVSDISATANDSTTTSGLKTSEAKTGFNVGIEANYDADESLVTVSMDLRLRSLKRFREMSGGNNLGALNLPETQEQELNSIVKLGAGETAMLGGLIIEEFSDDRSSLSVLENLPFGSQSIKNDQTAVFIMLRPTVTVFGSEK